MIPRSWAIGFGCVLVVGLLAACWMALRERKRVQPAIDPATGWLMFRHGIWFRLLAVQLAVGSQLMIVAMAVATPPRDAGEAWSMLGGIAIFAACGVPVMWEAVGFRMAVGPEGIDSHSPWRRRRFVPWGEVAEVAFKGDFAFHLRTSDRYKFSVSMFVPGLSAFLEACERYLPPQALDRARDAYTYFGRPFPEPASAPLATGEPPR